MGELWLTEWMIQVSAGIPCGDRTLPNYVQDILLPRYRRGMRLRGGSHKWSSLSLSPHYSSMKSSSYCWARCPRPWLTEMVQALVSDNERYDKHPQW